MSWLPVPCLVLTCYFLGVYPERLCLLLMEGWQGRNIYAEAYTGKLTCPSQGSGFMYDKVKKPLTGQT